MGRPPPAVSYDAVRLFLEAAERAGGLDADAVRWQISATKQYAGATRIARYDEARHPTKSAVVMTIENGTKKFYRHVDPWASYRTWATRCGADTFADQALHAPSVLAEVFRGAGSQEATQAPLRES